jgi:hypothetical protein
MGELIYLEEYRQKIAEKEEAEIQALQDELDRLISEYNSRNCEDQPFLGYNGYISGELQYYPYYYVGRYDDYEFYYGDDDY